MEINNIAGYTWYTFQEGYGAFLKAFYRCTVNAVSENKRTGDSLCGNTFYNGFTIYYIIELKRHLYAEDNLCLK